MADKEHRSDGFDEFKKQYDAAEVPNTDQPFNSSEYDLNQQLERFRAFSHSESENEMIQREAHLL